LKKLQLELDVTTIYVTHDQVEAMTMADRIMVQRDGIAEQIGTPHELYNHPANLFVAGFIGSPEMNFTDCTLIKEGKRLWLDAKEFKIPVPAEVVPKLKSYVGEDLIMGIRPEDLYERESVKAGTRKNAFRKNAFIMNVDVIETVGPYLLLHLRKGRLSLVARVKHTRARVGQEVSIEMDRSKIHIFDTKTTKAIL